MILDIARLVATHCGLAPNVARTLRVVYLRTTDPTFLVFVSHQAHPAYVVKVGGHDVLRRRHAVLTKLYLVMPETLAKPLGVYVCSDRSAIAIQQGLPGIPWFRLDDQFQTPSGWLALRQRAIEQLHRFHSAVASSPEWVARDVHFGRQLRDIARNMAAVLEPLGAGVKSLVTDAANTLDALGPMTGVWQHGDFTLNNLLIDDRRVSIIDLDDFGASVTPLLDNFSLALSVNLTASRFVPWHHRSEDLAACAEGLAVFGGYTATEKCAFYVSYLLTSVRQTLDRPSRDRIRSHYLGCLCELVGEGQRFTDAFNRSHPSGSLYASS